VSVLITSDGSLSNCDVINAERADVTLKFNGPPIDQRLGMTSTARQLLGDNG